MVLGALSLCACAQPDLRTAAPAGGEAFGYAPTTYVEHVDALQRVTLDAGELAYLDVGEGPVVLLVHGVPTSSWAYRKVAADLATRGYRVIAPDLFGYGASEKATTGQQLDPERQGARLLALMDALEIESWVQVVHDAGGPGSIAMLRQAGESDAGGGVASSRSQRSQAGGARRGGERGEGEGDQPAAWWLGQVFHKGLYGARRDEKVAAKWYRKLTETSTSSALPLDASRKQDALAWLARYDAVQQQR